MGINLATRSASPALRRVPDGFESGDPLIFRDIVDASPAAILLVSRDGPQRIEYANAAFRELSGYTTAEFAGRDWTEFFADEAEGAVIGAVSHAVFVARESRETLWASRKNGSRACIKLKISPLRGRSGHVTHCVMVLHDITAERHVHDTLEQQAHFDALTGLANRYVLDARFDEMLGEARAFRQAFSVVLLDLNEFKKVNDSFGHEVGDELLKCVGARLSEAMQAHDVVCRLGGDEFAMLIPEMVDGSWKSATLVRLLERIQQPADLKGHVIRPSCSVGVSHCPHDGADRESLMRVADRDLYRAKAARAWARA
jgi:diguanylate cyclase (GGDEF)-like protein/PAS domain S-box-containing protein